MSKFTEIQSVMPLPFEDKQNYLNEYKEFLYEIWAQNLNLTDSRVYTTAHKECFNSFYFAFASVAKNIMRQHFDEKTDEIKAYQKSIENEIESFRCNPQELIIHCKKHDNELKNWCHEILHYSSEREKYLKSQLINYRKLYLSPLTNANRLSSIKIGFKSECILLLSYAPNLTAQQASDEIDYWFNELKEYLDPVNEFKHRTNTQSDNNAERLKKYQVYFKQAVAENKDLALYEYDFSSLCREINLWSQIFEERKFYYREDYPAFRHAISTHIKIYTEAELLPPELTKWLEKYADNRFEKLEAYKHGAYTMTTEALLAIQKNYKNYLLNQVDEIKILPAEKLTPEFKNDILQMILLKARYFSPAEKYKADEADIINYFNSTQKSILPLGKKNEIAEMQK